MTYDLSLAKLVDLAIGTPETGSIDLTVLHSLLHIIVRKVGCQSALVELPPEQRMHLNLFIESSDVDPALSVLVEQRGENECFQVLPFDHNLAERQETSEPSAGFEDSQDILQRLQVLENRISILPSDEELRQYQSSRESLTPNDSVDFLNLASRLDKMEVNLGKLTALSNDLLVEFRCLEVKVLPFLDSGDLAVMQTQIHNINQLLVEHFPGFCSRRSSNEPYRGSQRLSIDTLPVDFYTKGVPTIAALARRPSSNQRFLSQQEKDIDSIKSVLNGLIELLPLPDMAGNEMLLTVSELSCHESKSDPKTNFHQKAANAIINIRSVQQEIDDLFLEKEEQLNALEVSQKCVVESCKRMQETVDRISNRFENIEDTICQIRDNCEKKLEDYRSSLSGAMENLIEDVEHLKNHMPRRIFELERQIDDRVDFEMFESRVSVEKFEASITMINQALSCGEDKFEDLKNQINSWVVKLCEKVDRKKLAALEIKINKKLALLQLRLNKRPKVDAIGTKIVGNLNCISCDNRATMRTTTDAVIPIQAKFRPKGYHVTETDGAEEFRKNRIGGELLQRNCSERASPKVNIQRLREARELVNQIKVRPLEFKNICVAPEEAVYKVHK